MFKGFLKATLEVQLAITCSVFSLLGGLILTFLASVSSFYLQKESIDFLGQGLADQLSRQIMESIETGDLIDLVGSLRSFLILLIISCLISRPQTKQLQQF